MEKTTAIELKADRYRLRTYRMTGIYVRALMPDGKWESVDISQLTKESLSEWLALMGNNNHCAENIIGILLGHGHLHT